ncbi:MAG TPA: hypothetical protein DD791_08370 [Syntrophomonas sp.]|nr:hypothetical protein [Syntrophomonas sp.]
MNTEDIIKAAFELGSAIAQSEEMINLKNQQTELMGKKEAYDLIMRYQDAKTKMDNKLMDGLLVTQQEEAHLDILEQQITSHSDIQILLAAQEKLENLMQAVYYAINQAVTGGCSSGCDSCGGSCQM